VPDVSTIVVTYNALPWVEQALASVPGTERIVVDHGSTDGTLELVRERFPDTTVIEQENRGFGAGNNAGMRVATGRWFLLLNSDAWLEPAALDGLVEFAEAHPDAAVVGPRLLNPDRTLQRSVRGFPRQAGAALARAQRLLRRRLRPRRAARGRVPDGLGHARSPRRRGRRGRLRRALLHVQ
jgi:GT2 family glycosyltransferase